MAISVGKVGDVPNGAMRAYAVGGTKVAVANVGGQLYAFGDTCTHRGCSLANGDLEGTTVTCACHGSEFDVTSGAVLEGPAEDPVGTWPITIEGDTIVIDA